MISLPPHRTKFPNPIVDDGQDPYVVIHNGYFYYCHVVDDEAIYIRKATSLDKIGQAVAIEVWRPPNGKQYTESIWAPELHQLDNKWYIYHAAGKRDERYSNQRMFVLEGKGDDPQQAAYTMKGQITDTSDEWAIDGTVLAMENGKRYLVWSGREYRENHNQNLYIAPMKNPWTLEGERVCIAKPRYDWEKCGLGVNEGPQVVQQGQHRHIIYSASWSITDHYCLGQLTLTGTNPMNPASWVKKPKPIFTSHGDLVAPGHASFILTEDGAAGWMIFHTARAKGAGWNRQVRLAAFTLSPNGAFKFV